MQASEAIKQWDDAVTGAEPTLVVAAARELFEACWDGEGGKAQEILERLESRKNETEGSSVVKGAPSREWVMIDFQELHEQKQDASTHDSEASPDRRDSLKEEGKQEQEDDLPGVEILEELHDACSDEQGQDKGSNLHASLSALTIADAGDALHGPTTFSARVTSPCKSSTIPELVKALGSGDVHKLEATTSLRKLLCKKNNPPISQVITAGAVPPLVEQLRGDDNFLLQFEAAWALTNIATGTTDHVVELISHGVVPIFVRLLRSPNLDVKEQAVWALGNIAGDSTTHRDLVLQSGALDANLQVLAHPCKLSLLRNATWMLANLLRGKPCVCPTVVKKALPTIARLIRSSDSEVLTEALWGLSYLSDGCNSKIQTVIDAGVLPRAVGLLLHDSPSVQTPALRTIGNIASGTSEQTQALLNTKALICSLRSLLQHPKRGIRKEACWTISNITAGTEEQVQAVVDGQLIPPLLAALQHSEMEVRVEAMWAVSNALSSGSPQQANYMANQGCTKALCGMLAAGGEPRVLSTALAGIEALLEAGAHLASRLRLDGNPYLEMLEEADGLDKMNLLLQHDNAGIRTSVQSILRNHIET